MGDAAGVCGDGNVCQWNWGSKHSTTSEQESADYAALTKKCKTRHRLINNTETFSPLSFLHCFLTHSPHQWIVLHSAPVSLCRRFRAQGVIIFIWLCWQKISADWILWLSCVPRHAHCSHLTHPSTMSDSKKGFSFKKSKKKKVTIDERPTPMEVRVETNGGTRSIGNGIFTVIDSTVVPVNGHHKSDLTNGSDTEVPFCLVVAFSPKTSPIDCRLFHPFHFMPKSKTVFGW